MVAASNRYWEGIEHAVLNRHNVPASWLKDPYLGHRLNVCNRAFCILYHGRQSLNNQVMAPHKLWSAMSTTMEDCGTAGWGLGVADMQDACDHLQKNGGAWTDEGLGTYHGGQGRSYNRMIVDVPKSIANFLEAIDDKLPKLTKAMEAYQKNCYAMTRLRITKDDPSKFEKINEHIGTIKDYADKAKDLLWLGPAAVQVRLPRTSAGMKTMQDVQKAFDGVTPVAEKVVDVLDGYSKITDALTMYTEAKVAFANHEHETTLAALFAATNFALSYVPVLGGAYGQIFKRIPGLVSDWREFVMDYHQRFENPIGFLRARERESRRPRCEFCNAALQ